MFPPNIKTFQSVHLTQDVCKSRAYNAAVRLRQNKREEMIQKKRFASSDSGIEEDDQMVNLVLKLQGDENELVV